MMTTASTEDEERTGEQNRHQPTVPDDGPWPGPVAYAAERRTVFIGRENEAARLVSLIQAYQSVLLHAPSGAGKSSLVSAEVVPELESAGYQIIGRARVQPLADPATYVDPAPVAEGERQLDPNPYEAGVVQSLGVDSETLRRLPLDQRLIRLASRVDGRGELIPTLVVFDQFEEILQPCEEYSEQQERFMAGMHKAIAARPNLRMLFVARDDHLGPILRLGRTVEGGFAALMHLDLMSRDNTEQLLRIPAERAGKSIAPEVISEIQREASVEHFRVLRHGEVETEPRSTQSRYISLLTLQVVARNLWHESGSRPKITLGDLEEIGGAQGALRDYYETSVRRAARRVARDARAGVGRISSIKSRDQWEVEINRFFEDQLISGHDQRQMVPAETARRAVGQPAIDVLLEHSIIRLLARGPEYYELCHDSFITPVREVQARRAADEAKDLRFSRRVLAGLAAVLAASIAIGLVMRDDAEGPIAPNLLIVEAEAGASAPSLVGQSVTEVVTELERLGLESDLNPVRSDLAEGIVVAQSPEAGLVASDGTVRLDVAAGPGLFTRGDSVVSEPSVPVVVDVLVNDEPALGPSQPLVIIDVRAEDRVEATIDGDRIRVVSDQAGEYLVDYMVSDGETEASGELTFVVRPFTAQIVASAVQVGVGEAIVLVDNTSSQGAVAWSFGDETGTTTTTGESVTKTYDTPGVYDVVMTATSERTSSSAVEVLQITVVGGVQVVTLLADSANLRSEPTIGGSVVQRIEGSALVELTVDRKDANGWYQITSGDHAGLWIFGSLVTPQTGELQVGITLDGLEPDLRVDGSPVDGDLLTGRFVLISGETDQSYEVLLPDGGTALLERHDIAIIDSTVPATELETEPVPLG